MKLRFKLTDIDTPPGIFSYAEFKKYIPKKELVTVKSKEFRNFISKMIGKANLNSVDIFDYSILVGRWNIDAIERVDKKTPFKLKYI